MKVFHLTDDGDVWLVAANEEIEALAEWASQFLDEEKPGDVTIVEIPPDQWASTMVDIEDAEPDQPSAMSIAEIVGSPDQIGPARIIGDGYS